MVGKDNGGQVKFLGPSGRVQNSVVVKVRASLDLAAPLCVMPRHHSHPS